MILGNQGREPRQKPEPLTAVVRRDQVGVFILHDGRTFRPDPHRLKSTPQNDMMYDLCNLQTPSIGANAMLVDYLAPSEGDLVDVHRGQDELVIGATMYVDQNSCYFAIHGVSFDRQIVTWSEDTTAFRHALN